jgi:transposase-like protein
VVPVTRQKSRFTPEAKRDIVLAHASGKVSMAELCREHQVSSQTIYNWRDAFMDAGLRGLTGDGPSQREAQLEREVMKLKEIVGDLTAANYLLKGGAARSMRSNGGWG